jgi:hypothetical protein
MSGPETIVKHSPDRGEQLQRQGLTLDVTKQCIDTQKQAINSGHAQNRHPSQIVKLLYIPTWRLVIHGQHSVVVCVDRGHTHGPPCTDSHHMNKINNNNNNNNDQRVTCVGNDMNNSTDPAYPGPLAKRSNPWASWCILRPLDRRVSTLLQRWQTQLPPQVAVLGGHEYRH